MSHCLNCGHQSHCGVNLMREEYNGRGKRLGQIEVCKHCRCKLCADVLVEEPWPGPGV